jgi:type IV pilus assembly protein PilW
MRRQRGFNLIELLIGLAISLMGLAAVSQVMMTFSKKRTAITQTAAAQDNGVMALYRMEKEISQAGYGLLAVTGLPTLQDCASIADSANGTSFSPVPVQITDGGAASDEITTRYAYSTSGLPGTELNASGGFTMTTSQYNVRSNVGFAVADKVVSTNSCAVAAVTSVATSIAIGYAPNLTASASSGYLVNLGPGGLVGRHFAITSGALTMGEYPVYTANNLVDEIVFLKAQYGLAASASGTAVTSWVSGATAITSANVARVIAIRVGVVARSAAQERVAIDQPNPLPLLPEIADGGGATIGAAVTYTVPDTTYRYRAYSTIIPLKNVIWTR